ncbi:MAG: hypothetical protein GDA44_04875 [Prochloron sp. SP5CPC1]|nr:hypothetical protein [Candidatus Paraprochloron terpiosi SP5CPC1]
MIFDLTNTLFLLQADSGGDPFGWLIVIGVILWLLYLLIIYVVLPILGVIIAIALILVASLAAFGSLVGIFVGLKNVYQQWVKGHKEAKARTPSTTPKKLLVSLYEPQPAHLMYMYDTGWFVMGFIAWKVWEPTNIDARKFLDRAGNWFRSAGDADNWVMKLWKASFALGSGLGGLFHYVAAFAIVLTFLTLQLVFLILGVMVTSCFTVILGLGNWLYGTYYKIYYRCHSCHHQMQLPIYTCPNCSTKHTQLWPSLYGVRFHTCAGTKNGNFCNEKLPTLDILGRSKLKQECPNPDCSSPIEGLGGTNVHLPIVGGPAAGKSHYIAMAVIQLIRDFAPTHSLQITLPNQEHQTNYDTNVKRLESGQRLLKTADLGDSAKAFNLQIKKSNRAVPKLLYLYDAAGESWTQEDRALLQKYFEYLHGIVLIIDPFSLEQVRTAYSSELSSNPGIISPSSENPEAVYERMVELLEIKFRGMTGSRRFKQLVAVMQEQAAAPVRHSQLYAGYRGSSRSSRV